MKTSYKMIPATHKKGFQVFIHEGRKPNMPYNNGMFVVSNQPNSPYVYCVKSEDLTIQA